MNKQEYFDARRLRLESVLMGIAVASKLSAKKVTDEVSPNHLIGERTRRCLEAIKENDVIEVKNWFASIGVDTKPGESVIDGVIQAVIAMSEKNELHESLAKIGTAANLEEIFSELQRASQLASKFTEAAK